MEQEVPQTFPPSPYATIPFLSDTSSLPTCLGSDYMFPKGKQRAV